MTEPEKHFNGYSVAQVVTDEQLKRADLIFTAFPGCRYDIADVSYLLVVKIQQVLDVLGAELDLPHIIVKQLGTFFQLLPDHLKNKSQYNTIRPRAFKTIFIQLI